LSYKPPKFVQKRGQGINSTLGPKSGGLCRAPESTNPLVFVIGASMHVTVVYDYDMQRFNPYAT